MSETNLVRHEKLGITLNLAREDLGHPQRPNLWEELRQRPVRRGEIRCMGRCYEREPNVPQWVYLREQPAGRRQGVHHNPGARANHAGENESDEHKALKERAATVAERAGLRATIEARAVHGKRITDVDIEGPNGRHLGVEFQLSRIGHSTIRRRASIAKADGLTPFWTTDNLEVPLQYAAPWSTIGRTTWQRIAAGTNLLVTGGVDAIEFDLCGRRHPRCPVGRPRPCGRVHAHRQTRTGVQLDELIVGAATGVFLPLEETKTGGGFNYRWLRAVDLERYLDDRSNAAAADPEGGRVHTRAADLACNRRVIPAQRRPLASSLNWSRNAAGDPRACRICRKPALMRDSDGRPCHKVCAESQPTHQLQEHA